MKQAHDAKKVKLPYKKPELVRFGKVTELTAGTSATANENSGATVRRA